MRARRWAGQVLTALLLVVAALAVLLTVMTRTSHGGQYTVFGRPLLTVVSGSMSPTISTGDLIVDTPIPPTETARLHVGQVVSFRVGTDQIYTHRIVGIVRDAQGVVSYRTRGDANNSADTALRPAGSVMGVYSFRIPKGGYLLADLHRPQSLVVLFGGIGLLLVGVRLMWRGLREPNNSADAGSGAVVLMQ